MRHAVAVLGLASACAVGPNFKRPPAPTGSRYTREGVTRTTEVDGVAQVVRPGQHLAATWWELFRSPELDALVRLALDNNASLAAAEASLRRSHYNLAAGFGVFYPQIDASAGATRQRFNPSRFGFAAPNSVFNLYTLGGTIGYTLDLFGGQRRTVEALGAQVDVECATLAGARLAVTGNVVNTVIARAGYQAELAATEELVKSLDDQLSIAQAQAQAGIAPYSTVLSLETQREGTVALLPPLRLGLARAEATLATLIGRAPSTWQPPKIELAQLALPRELPVSLPSELVRQRPDIAIAEATLHVSSANIGVATAQMLPSLTLSGSVGLNNQTLRTLFSSDSPIWSLGINLLAPLFHGGRLSNQRRAAIETYRQSLASYNQTVLTALADVATSLEALQHDADALAARSRGLAAATDARRLTDANYRAGVAGYLDLLISNAQYERALVSHIEAKAQRLQDTVALFVALGGGWWSSGKNACTVSSLRGDKR